MERPTHASLIGALALEKLARIPAKAEIASEFSTSKSVIGQATLFFAVTQSGETSDTLGAIKEINKGGQNCRYRKCCWLQYRTRVWSWCLHIHSGSEMAVASTKAFSNILVAMYLFTLQAKPNQNMSLSGLKYARGLSAIPDLVEGYLNSNVSIYL